MSQNKTQITKSELIHKFFPIYFYRKRLDIAARDMLGLDLSPHHRVTLRDWGKSKHYNHLLASRGMGKSVLIAIYYVLMAVLYPKNKLMIVGGTGFRQSKMVMLEMEKIILNRLSGQRDVNYIKASLVDRRRVINKDPSFWSISLVNGSIVYAVPIGDGSTIRGLRSYITAQDEAFLLSSNLVQSVLDPMLNVLYDPTKSEEEQEIKSQSIKTSTIDYAHRSFYKEYLKYRAVLGGNLIDNSKDKLSNSDISVFEWNFEDAYYETENDKTRTVWGIDYKRIKERKNNPNIDEDIWLAENKNIPMDISGGYFSFDSVDKCSNVLLNKGDLDSFPEVLESCSGECILGVDTAPASANSAFVVIKVGNLNMVNRDVSLCKVANFGQPCPLLGKRQNCLYGKYNAVIYAYEENKMSQKDRIKLIYDLMDRYNIISVAMDARGGGYELADLLKDRDYIKNVIGHDQVPIYDPQKDTVNDAIPVLNLYTTNQKDNLIFNAYLKALLSNTKITLPKALRSKPENNKIFEIYGHIETLVNQLIRIKAIPQGKFLKFDIEVVSPETGRKQTGNKDLYSALLYAVARERELKEEQRNTVEEQTTLSAPVLFNM